MRSMRKRHSAEFKAQVALAAIANTKTINDLAGRFEVHPTQVRDWKKQALAAVPDAFSGRRSKDAASNEELLTSLYEQIGRQKVELEWLKKKMGPWT